jgi:hypothetical protein
MATVVKKVFYPFHPQHDNLAYLHQAWPTFYRRRDVACRASQ